MVWWCTMVCCRVSRWGRLGGGLRCFGCAMWCMCARVRSCRSYLRTCFRSYGRVGCVVGWRGRFIWGMCQQRCGSISRGRENCSLGLPINYNNQINSAMECFIGFLHFFKAVGIIIFTYKLKISLVVLFFKYL